MINMQELQSRLLREGLAIAAHCTHEAWGNLIENVVIADPGHSLVESYRMVASEKLREAFRLELESAYFSGLSLLGHAKEAQVAEQLTRELSQFNESNQGPKTPAVQWLAPGNPFNGMFMDMGGDTFPLFDLRISPKIFNLALREKLAGKLDDEGFQCLLDCLEDMKMEPRKSRGYAWEDFLPLSESVCFSRREKKKRQQFMKQCVTGALAPVLDGYKQFTLCVASYDTAYFEIGRSHFFPSIVGERIDGKHEVSIFRALNEF